MKRTTKLLAEFTSGLRYDDLPDPVIEGALLAVTDSLGNLIGGSVLEDRLPFIRLSKSFGGSGPSSSLLRNGARVGMAGAAFGNCAQVTLMDFCDGAQSTNGHLYIWPGAVAVPAAFATAEAFERSGKALLTSVVAGYECATRIVHSMDIDSTEPGKIQGGGVAVFAAAGAAGNALRLSKDQMTSALGMAGIYSPVPSGYRFYGDVGLKPRADITHGWAWMSMTGVFAAHSAQEGLEMLQEQNILDGNLGLWRMLGMNAFNENKVTDALGSKYNITEYHAKRYPGCAFTHASIIGATRLASENKIKLETIESIEVVTNRREAIGFDDQDPVSLVDRMFSVPAQVSAALLAGDPGPNWYSTSTRNDPFRRSLARRIFLSFDEECEAARDSGERLSKVIIKTKDGRTFSTKISDLPAVRTRSEVEEKFLTTTEQVVGSSRAHRILAEIRKLTESRNLDQLIELINNS